NMEPGDMRIVIPSVVLLVLLASGCENQNDVTASNAEQCKAAEEKGLIEFAEKACEQAWHDAESDRLGPEIQSERLYNLARIKRKLNAYIEADKLIRQALTIEETVSGTSSPAYGQRLVELSLSLIGQGKLIEGAKTLDQALNIVDQFSEENKKTTANILMHFASRLRDTDQAQLANRFELKAKELKAKKQSDTGQTN
ncbi:MAG: tetratricopeptide repeat protein, partial [Gammaproteobacteria bacterium]|nr:tetratricopeptide repeat protein [Gammaproteobacteria bacterium]